MLINLIVFFVLLSVGISIILYYKQKGSDVKIQSFYKAVEEIRNRSHTIKSNAEVRELFDEVIYLEETFNGMISDVVLNKEISLLKNVLNKKFKKLK